MFDPETAGILSSAPSLPGLDPESLPLVLTRHYAQLISARLQGLSDDGSVEIPGQWSLDRIADAYELLASIVDSPDIRRASAFVAATAQQILSKSLPNESKNSTSWNVDRDQVDPTLAAPLLFLAAEQYADANEAALAIIARQPSHPDAVSTISYYIRDLASGHLSLILNRAKHRMPQEIEDFESKAFVVLIETLVSGIEKLATYMLSPEREILPSTESGRDDFLKVLKVCTYAHANISGEFDSNLSTTYSGPRHLASLLLATHDGIRPAALTNIPPPLGSDAAFWHQWISYRAKKFPYVWPNHREAIARDFHQSGQSAVVVLPTGAGKTTVSSLKIAGVLAKGMKVLFLAPTHALVDQLIVDLQEMFPQQLLGSVVSGDYDLLLQLGAKLKEIEVMTPERCLAMLSFASDAFDNVGLLVFDECHLLSPQSGKIRRSLDGMLCILLFSKVNPNADFLFLSAMLKNGEDFAHWISQLTSRSCISVDLLWKPSRQARGVVIYNNNEINTVKNDAIQKQHAINTEKRKSAKNLRAAAAKALVVHPYAVWGLQHNWLSEFSERCSVAKILDTPVQLGGNISYGSIHITPNSNSVSAMLAVAAARNDIKTIVFVNQKNHAVSTAQLINNELDVVVTSSASEKKIWLALSVELGDLTHSLLGGPSAAVPHNASMLRLERDLAERMFKRIDGAKVIVATPTLAQGLNLPAQLAILAGDKRADPDAGGREKLEAHEILNAAARAGRAGHHANGVVLLVPEPIISFSEDSPISPSVVNKLKSIFPENDHCVTIIDPIGVILDRIMDGYTADRDVSYTINRMMTLRDIDANNDATSLFNIDRSLAAYASTQNSTEAEFSFKLDLFKKLIESQTQDGIDPALTVLASQSGLSTTLLMRIKSRIVEQIGSLPTSVEGWVIWMIEWIKNDAEAHTSLLYDVKKNILAATGRATDAELTAEVIQSLLPGILSWISGKPIYKIEVELGGNPIDSSETSRTCPRARELVVTIIPRCLSFVLGLISHIVDDLKPYDNQQDLNYETIGSLGTALRKGFDSHAKLIFSQANLTILSRVQVHIAYERILSK